MDLYSIGKVSKMCSIPIKTLRYYDEIGLLMPEQTSVENNYRYYSRKNIMQIAIIKYFKMIGFTLEEIKEILNREDNEVLEVSLLNRLEQLKFELNNINQKIAAIQNWNKLLEAGKNNYSGTYRPVKVSVEKIPSTKVLKLNYHFEKTTNFLEIIFQISNEFTVYCDKQDFLTFGSFIGYFPDRKKRLMNMLQDARFYSELVDTKAVVTGTEEIREIKAVKALHIGTYSQISKTYQVMREWADTHNIMLQKESFEKYIIDPWSGYSEDNYVTEILIPLRLY